jgi:predicted nucleotidyltransferase
MISLRSEVTKKLFNHFFLDSTDNVYVNELHRKLQVDKRNLVKKLKELEQEGILKTQSKGNLKLYTINKSYPLYEEYKRIFLKTVGFEDKVKKVVNEIEGVKEAYIYGSYAKNTMDTHSDIDLLVIGNHSIISLQRKLNKLQQEIGREINVVNMDENEFKKRKKSKDPFIAGILREKHIRVI